MALKNKTNMYKIWRSKQNLGFCDTRVQISHFSGNSCPDEPCPNCGHRETAMHLMLCPDKDCTNFLTKTVNKLTKWMAQDNITDPEILYWIPKFSLMRGEKPLSEMGAMSHQFRALVDSQDLIGWRYFTKGYISRHFHAIQSFYLTMTSSYLNGEDWTKQFISKLLQITHSQWIYHISLHGRQDEYLHAMNAAEIMQEIETLSNLSPKEVAKESFLPRN